MVKVARQLGAGSRGSSKVHPADVHDKEGAKLLLAPLRGKLPRMAKVWADSAYQGLKK
jgi:hypothetical protein